MPEPRGPVSSALLDAFRTDARGGQLSALTGAVNSAEANRPDMLQDDDLQLALFCLYQLHYSGINGVDDRWEWDPALLAVRGQLEELLETAVRSQTEVPALPSARAAAVAEGLFAMVAGDDGPSMSRFIAREATAEQVREMVIHRSLSQLREADPHTWAIPRLTGPAKAALVEIQADEYGGGRPDRVHAVLYARAMRGLGLDDTYGAYLNQIPAAGLAAVNLMSLFGLHRRLRGAIIGHLAIYEMSSSIPNGLYARGFRRLGFGEDVTEYFDEHVEADAVHEQIAGFDMAGALVEAEPALLKDVLFGAAAAQAVDAIGTEHILRQWNHQSTSLRTPLPQLGG